MKKQNLYIAFTILVTISFTGCKKFLDVTPQVELTTGNAYKSARDAESALAGIYFNFMSTNYWQWEYGLLAEIRSDNAYGGGSGDVQQTQLDQLTVPSGSGLAARNWAELYRAIGVANVLLEKINGITDPELTATRRSQIIGEALFLRAFNYYQLVNEFGGLPLEVNSNTSDPDKIRIPRSTEAETYNFIIKDLETALVNLPDTYGSDPSVNKVRATRGAVNALLAKAWAQRKDRDYNKVFKYCNDVINSPAAYKLLDSYAQVFDGANYLNSESILEIPFIKGDASGHSNWGIELNLPTFANGEVDPGEYQRYCVPSVNLVNAYNSEGDVIRFNTNIIFKNVPWTDENWNPCNDPNVKVPFAYKQHDPNYYASGDHTYLLRLSDIILLKAEAQNELNDLNEAKKTVNIIRHRVSLGDVVANDKEEMRNKILLERRLELAFEGHRWDDLVRSGKLVTVMNNLNEVRYTCAGGNTSNPIPVIYNVTSQKELMPIPQAEIDVNPRLKQNSGY